MMELPESVVTMANQHLSDAQRAAPYRGQKLRQVLCVPLETLTDDYLREQHLTIEAIFQPVPGPIFDEPVKANSLVMVVKKARQE